VCIAVVEVHCSPPLALAYGPELRMASLVV
jgi:hypothetical protein